MKRTTTSASFRSGAEAADAYCTLQKRSRQSVGCFALCFGTSCCCSREKQPSSPGAPDGPQCGQGRDRRSRTRARFASVYSRPLAWCPSFDDSRISPKRNFAIESLVFECFDNSMFNMYKSTCSGSSDIIDALTALEALLNNADPVAVKAEAAKVRLTV